MGNQKFFTAGSIHGFSRLAVFMIFQTGSIHDRSGVTIFMIDPGWQYYDLSAAGNIHGSMHGFPDWQDSWFLPSKSFSCDFF